MIIGTSVLVVSTVLTIYLLRQKKITFWPALVVFLFGYSAYSSTMGPAIGRTVESVAQFIQSIHF